MTSRLTLLDYEKIADTRNHLVIDFSLYTGVHSPIKFYCITCNGVWTASGQSYKNAKQTGCPGCKRIKTSQVHTGKIVSEDTRRLISEKAAGRPGSLLGRFGVDHPCFKGGIGRDLSSPSKEDYAWKNAVRARYKYKCALTGSKEIPCCCHHLYSWNSYPKKRHDLNNGVYISYKVHKEFHDLYKYGNNTEEQWSEYVSKYHNVDWYKIRKSV